MQTGKKIGDILKQLMKQYEIIKYIALGSNMQQLSSYLGLDLSGFIWILYDALNTKTCAKIVTEQKALLDRCEPVGRIMKNLYVSLRT